MKILIVGGGIAGLALAGFLRKKGLKPDIIEKNNDWEHVGFALGLWNNGRKVLCTLGYQKRFDAAAKVCNDYVFTNGKGKLIKLYHFEDFKKKYGPTMKAMVCLPRETVDEMLLEAAGPVQMGVTVVELANSPDGVEVAFSNGQKKKYDLVVGADGIHSSIREMLFGKGHIEREPWRGWWFWVDANMHDFPDGVLEVWEPGRFYGAFPHGGAKVCSFLLMPWEKEWTDDEKDRLLRLKEHFKDFSLVPKLLDSLKPSDLSGAEISHVNLDQWYKDRVILIGDAAHCMEPFAGMGASMALEDAFVLAEELGKSTLSEDFERYVQRRKPRVFHAKKQMKTFWELASTKSSLRGFFEKLFIPLIPVKHFTKDYEWLLKEPI